MAPLPDENNVVASLRDSATSPLSSASPQDSNASTITPRPGPSAEETRTSEELGRQTLPSAASASGAGIGFNTGVFRTSAAGAHKPKHSSPLSSPSPARKRESETQVPQPGSPSLSAALRKSVSFSSGTSLPKPERRGSYGLMARMEASQEHEEDEMNGDVDGTAESSSADESTAIVRKRTGGNYGATAGNEDESVQDEGTQDENVGGAEEHVAVQDGTVRKRKSSRGRKASRGPRIPGQEGVEAEEEHDSWWKIFVEKYGSVELENKGSVARDHLALERTFLAWLRTSLSFASIGIAVTQLFRLNTSLNNDHSGTSSIPTASLPSSGSLVEQLGKRDVSVADNQRLRHVGKPLGATFLGISIVILILGFHRYFESQHYVIRGKFPASRGTIIIVSTISTALIISSLVVVLTVAPSALEK